MENETYHMPDEGGKFEGSLEENQVNDMEEKPWSIEPEELIARLEQDWHQMYWDWPVSIVLIHFQR